MRRRQMIRLITGGLATLLLFAGLAVRLSSGQPLLPEPLLPFPSGSLPLSMIEAGLLFLLVAALGKFLYDTLFMDHFWP